MFVFAFALLMAGQAEPAPVDPALDEDTPAVAPAAHDDEEICRRITVPSPKSAGGKKTSKVCKTKEEWKDFAMRRS